MVSSVKWVDEVIPNTPYCLTETFLHKLFSVHKIDFVIHGDDPCILPDGSDAYAAAKKLGKFKQIKRTEGVSSTNLVGTFLFASKNPSAGIHRWELIPSGKGEPHKGLRWMEATILKKLNSPHQESPKKLPWSMADRSAAGLR